MISRITAPSFSTSIGPLSSSHSPSDSTSKVASLIFRRLEEVDKASVMKLMNNSDVLRLMPLAKKQFDDADYEQFIAAKKQLWDKHGYGPWAFVVDGNFAGWGGLQYEQGDADLAIVLSPQYWGLGRQVYQESLKLGFDRMGFRSITALIPPTRNHSKALSRFHFKPDGELMVGDQNFLRFRLFNNNVNKT